MGGDGEDAASQSLLCEAWILNIIIPNSLVPPFLRDSSNRVAGDPFPNADEVSLPLLLSNTYLLN